MYFPSGIVAEAGKENLGKYNCKLQKHKDSDMCTKVYQVTLELCVIGYVKSLGLINHISIDIEDYDVDALYSAGKVLDQTQYIEFEYNWKGSWEKNKLSNVIKMLDSKEYTCYFIGNDELWKITGSCFLDYYDIRMWSNVGCVHRLLAPDLYKNMEKLFKKTLGTPVDKLNYLTISLETFSERMNTC